MARPKRYHQSGAFYHVMLRGNDGIDIFFSDADRCAMCLLIQEGVERYQHRIHAFCFMSNHIHLLIQIADIPLSKIIHNLAFRYSQRINRKKSKKGHLFQGRFKAIAIQEIVYFKRLLRYIHQNPVRASLVKNPSDYLWSGHNVYLGKNEIAWLTTDYGLSKFDNIKEIARSYYQAYVLKQESQDEINELRAKIKDGQVLGDDNFLEEIQANIKPAGKINLTLDHVINKVSQHLGISKELIFSSQKSRDASFARAVIALIAKEKGNIAIWDIGESMKRDE